MKLKHLFTHLTFTLFISIFFFGSTLFAQNLEDNKTELSVVKTADDIDLKWNPAPDFFPNCSFTILHGDIEKPNLDFFFKIEANTEVVNHTHNSPERMILITGVLEVTYEGEKTQILKAGTYTYGPARKPHKAKCLDKGPCVLFVAMINPFDAFPIVVKD